GQRQVPWLRTLSDPGSCLVLPPSQAPWSQLRYKTLLSSGPLRQCNCCGTLFTSPQAAGAVARLASQGQEVP
ncbi:hypothetical protein HaLaN_30748, partial [Haematococcus lacustris]